MTSLAQLLAGLGNDGAVRNARQVIEDREAADQAMARLERSLLALENAGSSKA